MASRPRPRNGALADERAAGQTALLVIDMISVWDFPDAARLLPHAARIAPAVARLRRRCMAAGVPVIYANDHRGRWRSDFPALVQQALAAGGEGARIAGLLAPGEQDYFVLKPQQSAFHATPLALLLQHLQVRRLLLAGVASDQCILATAIAARMRDLEVVVPRDCTATQTARRQAMVLEQFDAVFKLSTTPGPRIRLAGASSRGTRP